MNDRENEFWLRDMDLAMDLMAVVRSCVLSFICVEVLRGLAEGLFGLLFFAAEGSMRGLGVMS